MEKEIRQPEKQMKRLRFCVGCGVVLTYDRKLWCRDCRPKDYKPPNKDSVAPTAQQKTCGVCGKRLRPGDGGAARSTQAGRSCHTEERGVEDAAHYGDGGEQCSPLRLGRRDDPRKEGRSCPMEKRGVEDAAPYGDGGEQCSPLRLGRRDDPRKGGRSCPTEERGVGDAAPYGDGGGQCPPLPRGRSDGGSRGLPIKGTGAAPTGDGLRFCGECRAAYQEAAARFFRIRGRAPKPTELLFQDERIQQIRLRLRRRCLISGDMMARLALCYDVPYNSYGKLRAYIEEFDQLPPDRFLRSHREHPVVETLRGLIE